MGTKDEMVCEGGEEGFVGGIVKDSLLLRERVRWYTTMLGRKQSVKAVLRILREAGVKNIVTTTFFQGRTTRWGVGWCFEDERVQDSALRLKVDHQVAMGKRKAKKKNNQTGPTSGSTFTVPHEGGVSVVSGRLSEIVSGWKQKGFQIEQTADGSSEYTLNMTLPNSDKALGPRVQIQVLWQESKGDEGMVDTVAVTFERGEPETSAKSQFLVLAAQIKADIQRTNRRWRRLKQKQQQSN